jgi:hypothetical protein
VEDDNTVSGQYAIKGPKQPRSLRREHGFGNAGQHNASQHRVSDRVEMFSHALPAKIQTVAVRWYYLGARVSSVGVVS